MMKTIASLAAACAGLAVLSAPATAADPGLPSTRNRKCGERTWSLRAASTNWPMPFAPNSRATSRKTEVWRVPASSSLWGENFTRSTPEPGIRCVFAASTSPSATISRRSSPFWKSTAFARARARLNSGFAVHCSHDRWAKARPRPDTLAMNVTEGSAMTRPE